MDAVKRKIIGMTTGAGCGLGGMLTTLPCAGAGCAACFGCAGVGVGLAILLAVGKFLRQQPSTSEEPFQS